MHRHVRPSETTQRRCTASTRGNAESMYGNVNAMARGAQYQASLDRLRDNNRVDDGNAKRNTKDCQ